MFGALASSAGCSKGPKSSKSDKNLKSSRDKQQTRSKQDKERDTFLSSEELFQIISKKRNIELAYSRQKQQGYNKNRGLFTQGKEQKNKDTKHGVCQINQAICASVSAGSDQFARKLSLKAEAIPKT